MKLNRSRKGLVRMGNPSDDDVCVVGPIESRWPASAQQDGFLKFEGPHVIVVGCDLCRLTQRMGQED